jgi:rhodanese-related sulfurtransferase
VAFATLVHSPVAFENGACGYLKENVMPSRVSEVPAADSARALLHFESALAFETDCWDVHEALAQGADFVLIDVRAPHDFARGHVPGALNIPHAKIIASRMAHYPSGTLFVVYCAGPHCNGAQRGAVRLARLGLAVKLMIGGMTGWLDEGFRVASTEA